MNKKRITLLSIVLFVISSLIVSIYGKNAEFYQKIDNLENLEISCPKDKLKCNYKIKDGYIHFNIKSKQRGKTTIIIQGNNTKKNNKKEITRIKVFIHPFGIITLGNYFGYCKGDLSFVFSFYIIMIVIIISLIKKYKKSIKENLYSYKNPRLFGLIVFLTIPTTIHLFFMIYDLSFNYHPSIKMLINTIREGTSLFLISAFPVALLLTILVTISNIKLILNEGKKWTNLLGTILGSFFCISTLLLITFVSISSDNIYINIFLNIIILYIVYLECIFIGTCVVSSTCAKHIPNFDKDYIIILGCKIKKDNTLTPLLQSRVDKAIEFAKMQKEKTNKDIVFVPSGGNGKDENLSEAEAIKNYLLEKGIKKEKIIIEDQSTNTFENIKFSNKKIKEENKNANIAFSTTNYHVFRTGILATKQNIKIEGIGAKTKTYYWINAFIREFAATLVSEKKEHIKTLIILTLIVISISIITLI